MRHNEPDQPGTQVEAATTEERLRRENQDLKRQLQELKASAHGSSHAGLPMKVWHPSSVTIWSIVLGITVLIVVAFFAGYIPLRKQRALIVSEAHEQEQALPRVEVVEVGRSSRNSALELPGSIQAITEAPILARADGYLQRRMVDIGDRVKSGQPLAEIEAPEVDEQIRQARAALQQAQAAVEQATANYQRGQADEELAKVTAELWSALLTKGVVSRQENDRYQSEYRSLTAATKSLDKALAMQRSN